MTTRIVLVEDRGLLALSIANLFRQSQELLRPYELDGPLQIVASGHSLLKWLDGQPPASVRLLLLDFSIIGGTSSDLLKQVRDPLNSAPVHPALHPAALAIGWSAYVQSAATFQAARADGFISKQRPVAQLVEDILTVLNRRSAGEPWVELH